MLFRSEPGLADNAMLKRAFSAGYWPVAFSPHDTIALFIKTNTVPSLSKSIASRLLPLPGITSPDHFFSYGPFIVNRDGNISGLLDAHSKQYAPADGFAIECTLTASSNQPVDAFLFGNPPRSGTPGGFLLQKQGAKPGEFAWVWGHARKWQPRLLFHVPAGKKTHIIVTGSKSSGKVAVFTNGIASATAHFPGMDSSPDALLIGRIGNTYAHFSGLIHEIRLFNQVLDETRCRAMAAHALQFPD